MLVGGDVARPGWPRARLGGEVAAREEAKWRREASRARKRREFGGAGLEEGAWLPKMEGRLPFIGRARVWGI